MKGYIVHSSYSTQEGKTLIHLFGRLENGQSFLTLNEFKPFFFIREKDRKKVAKIKEAELEETDFKNFKGEPVLKLVFNTKTELDNTFKKIHKDIETYEADLRPQLSFLIEHDILSTLEIKGDHEPSEKVDRVFYNPELKAQDFKPKLKVISLDTESGDNGNLYCIGLTSEKYKKNFMVTDKKLKDTVSCKDEEECLKRAREEIIKQDPDIIIGWNVIDFDFPYLRDLYRKHKIPFDFGRTNEEPRIRIESNFFRASKISLPGRQVLDGLNMVKDSFIKEAPSIKFANFESFTLEDVSQEILGRGKLLKGKNRHEEIIDLYKSKDQKKLQKLVDYNLTDCELVYDIMEKTKMLDLAVERSQLTGLTMDKLTASIVAFDSLYIRAARKKKLVSPTNQYRRREDRITGGYVQDSKPGIYKNVLVFDFKSLYSSVIKTFNIDPSSFLDKKEKGAIESPNKAYFRNTQGILPGIIQTLHLAREKAKKEKRELSNHAIKVIMNSFWGVLASPNCRYFDFDMGNAITSFARWATITTAKEIEKKYGFPVIYGDTDSVFVETKLPKKKAESLGKEIEKYINDFYKKYIREHYSRDSFLELEFEKQYLAMAIPKIRGKENTAGAKKRYAGLKASGNKEELEVVGLEAIRGDWTEAAQDFQRTLLMKLFHEEPIEKFIRDYIKKIESGKLDDKLVYRKSIRKALSEYTKTTPPHVKAARKLDKLEGSIIEYYITLEGPEPIQKLEHKLDYKHYIDKQIKPIAQQVLVLLGKDFDDTIAGSKQAKLF